MPLKSWRFAALAFFCISVAGYALWAYGSGVQRVPVHPAMIAVFDQRRALITTHAIAASLALLLGPFQFVDRLRARAPRLHRGLGYTYLVAGVAVGGSSGILLARHSFGGFVSHLGFGLLACLWMITGVMATRAALQRRFEDHRVWMIRNFALTFAAVTLRLYLGLFFAAGLRFEDFYPAVAWLCWVPNLIAVEWWQPRRSSTPPRPGLSV
ncbi:MAG: DUF2306 domain-containing protein [Undibacterium sp.]|nr:DUF2306 domain-containing protein [Opitutaceae bacterium]